MATDATLMPAQQAASPEPEILTLRTQLVSAGHTKDLLARTDTARPPRTNALNVYLVMLAPVAGIHVLLCDSYQRRGWPGQARP